MATPEPAPAEGADAKKDARPDFKLTWSGLRRPRAVTGDVAEDVAVPAPQPPVIGLALGSGSARGWSHIGVILELEALGIRPQVVAGTSIGALVGAVYAAGQLQELADWVSALTVRDVMGLMDVTFTGGGMVRGEKLFSTFAERHSNPNIEDLALRYASVCTEMASGREIWITQGPILTAARASCALPGVFTPVKHQGRWMLDGGLVNPVPVSTCRALGADVVIAVNLNAQLVGAHWSRASRLQAEQEIAAPSTPLAEVNAINSGGGLPSDDARGRNDARAGRGFWQKVMGYLESSDPDRPALFDVVAASVNIMQDRLTRSRMAGDPPEITLVPLLEDYALMDFHRAEQAIAEGRALVRRHEAELCAWAQPAAR
ncbi:patatin-like phospholipase family protein [Sinimarinibacterium sp. NLF-5-8]|uniref:patatin-like phospholipase family protein n=1 Tax=Sinimarinibacterium sp. NLF-5-8 TaxID=2698684 RepID=UPI00137BC946|nr:patatin-like phospholipase family protein [Sinimarinibacterium sp. NLF-5-8]QHS11252.1 patatin [Sinimarinibacterium sp. NLF-5-8]